MRIDRSTSNRLAPYPGMPLYRAHSGDTLRRVAERLGIRLTDLMVANPHVASADVPLRPGQILQIPTDRTPTANPSPPPAQTFRDEYESIRPNVFQRLAGPPVPTAHAAGKGLGGPTQVDRYVEAVKGLLWDKYKTTTDLVEKMQEFLKALDPRWAERVGKSIYDLVEKIIKSENVRGRVEVGLWMLDGLAKFCGDAAKAYQRLREMGIDDPGLAVSMTLLKKEFRSTAMELLKAVYPEYFPKSKTLQGAELIGVAVEFAEKVLGVPVPKVVKDLTRLLKYLPSTFVATLVKDTTELAIDMLIAGYQAARSGDFIAWNEVISRMLKGDYGLEYQGWAFLADLVLTGGRNVPLDKSQVLLEPLFGALLGKDRIVFRETPQLDAFLKALRNPALLYGLYRTGRLNPADVAAQLFIALEQNGTQVNFARRLRQVLDGTMEAVRRGEMSYSEWTMFREVVRVVVDEVLWRASMGPWSVPFRERESAEALQEVRRVLSDPLVDQDLRFWAEAHAGALEVFGGPTGRSGGGSP